MYQRRAKSMPNRAEACVIYEGAAGAVRKPQGCTKGMPDRFEDGEEIEEQNILLVMGSTKDSPTGMEMVK
jgi:hypothetical protein